MRLGLLLGLYLKTRFRGFIASGASSVFLVLGALFYLGFSIFMGVAANTILSGARAFGPERLADLAALGLNLFGVFFLTRPLILATLSGSSLQNLLHLPVRRGELLAYSFITGVVAPLFMEAPVLIGIALGAAATPAHLALTFPLAFLAHLVLLAGAHAMSLVAILIARHAWVADAARVLAFSVFVIPTLLTSRAVRAFLEPVMNVVVELSPLGWAGRATVLAGRGDLSAALPWTLGALIFGASISFVSLALLNRVLDGEGGERVLRKPTLKRRSRLVLPGGVGAMIEVQLKSQLRTPAARMALITPMLMMGLFTWSFTRQSDAGFNPAMMVAIVSLAGPSAFLTVGRGIALVLGTPAPRASLLVASDVSSLFFRVPPILAVLGVTAWRLGWPTALGLSATAMVLLAVSSGIQHFVAILGPFSLPKDRLNPYAQRVDSRRGGHGLLNFGGLLVAIALAAPFLFLLWLAPRLFGGAFAPAIGALSILGALATYAVLVALAERLLIRREQAVVEVLLDDSAG